MTNEEIIERIAQGEDSRTQFKRGPIGAGKLAAELAAFTNAEGGMILFGVEDDGTVAGLDAEAKKALDSEISCAANDNVRPPVYPRTEFHTIGGKQILAVHVAEGVSKPYADKSGNFWTKSGPDKRRITAREELQRLLQASLLIHADEMPVAGSGFGDLDLYHLGEFLESAYELPYRGLGTGVMRAISLGAEVEFASDRELNLFRVVIRRNRHGMSANLPEKPGDLPVKSADPSVNLPGKMAGLPENLPENLRAVVEAIVRNPGVTYEGLAEESGKSRETVRVWIRRLKEEYGVLRRVGSAKKGRWEIVEHGEESPCGRGDESAGGGGEESPCGRGDECTSCR